MYIQVLTSNTLFIEYWPRPLTLLLPAAPSRFYSAQLLPIAYPCNYSLITALCNQTSHIALQFLPVSLFPFSLIMYHQIFRQNPDSLIFDTNSRIRGCRKRQRYR